MLRILLVLVSLTIEVVKRAHRSDAYLTNEDSLAVLWREEKGDFLEMRFQTACNLRGIA